MGKLRLNRFVHAFGCLASAIPYFILVVVMTRTWIDPLSVDEGAWVPLAVGLMALEFILLHSGVFMGTMAQKTESAARRIGVFALLVAFYGLLAYAFSMVAGSWEILKIFGFLMAGRLLTLVVASNEGKRQLIERSAAGIVAYILVAFLTVFVPFPELGVNAEVLREVYPHRGGGLWERQPERAIAGAILYFGLMGLFELKQLARHSDTAPAHAGASEAGVGDYR